MTTRETVRKMIPGQHRDITATVVGAIPNNLSSDEAQAIIGAKGTFVAKIREMFAKLRHIQMNVVPMDDEWFDLEVDNDIDPMSVIVSAYHDPTNWRYLGPQLSGKKTLRVKLVHLYYVRNVDEAKKKADEIGCRLVQGQAREPFKARFSKPDGKGPVVFGGSEWQYPNGYVGVACLYDFGDRWTSSFHWSDDVFSVHYRWLVVGK